MNSSDWPVLPIGDWCFSPRHLELSRNGETVRLQARTMRVLYHLACHAGELVSVHDLREHVWNGGNVTSDTIEQAVESLRRIFGDDPLQPAYIATVPQLGYRLVAPVGPWIEPNDAWPVYQTINNRRS